jgi:hypothetical protein
MPKTIHTTRLETAIERLNARKVGTRYHYHAGETGEDYSVTEAEMRLLGRMLADEIAEHGRECWAYSEWCAAVPARVVRRA